MAVGADGWFGQDDQRCIGLAGLCGSRRHGSPETDRSDDGPGSCRGGNRGGPTRRRRRQSPHCHRRHAENRYRRRLDNRDVAALPALHAPWPQRNRRLMPAERLPGEPAAEVKHWLAEISAAKKREKDFRKDGREIIEIYSGCEAEKTPFNILYSNTETLLPALFSQTPRPVVQRRFKDEDPLGKAASLAAQRMLEYLCDTNVEGYETFDAAMEAATLDGLLPGRGVTGVKYDAETSETAVEWEQVCVDSRKWDCVYFGFARKWSKVPWIAYEEYVDQDEAKRLFGDAIAAKMKFEDEEQAEEDDEGDGKNKSDDGDEDSDRKVALVYQIWDRAGGKRVRYISPGYPDGYLKDDADPYGITGFFNCPRPLQFLAKSNDLMPTALYALYKNQAEELNNITRRIKSLVAAIKVRGAYDGSLGDQIGKILEAEDLTIQPTDDGAMIGQAGGVG